MSAHRIIVPASAIAAAAMLACTGAAGGHATGGTSQLTSDSTGTSGGASAAPSSTASSTSATYLTSGLGTFTALLTDAPNPDVSEIWVKVTAVTIHYAGAGWIPLANGVTYPVSVDLLKLQQTATTLGFLTLPPGTVTQIRLLIADEDGANYVVLSAPPQGTDPKVPLKVPSGYESGIKIIGKWDVAPCSDTAVTLDFDGHNSIWYHPTGHDDEWILRPVIRVRGAVTTPITCPTPGSGGDTSPTTVGLGGSCTATADCVATLVCSAPPSPQRESLHGYVRDNRCTQAPSVPVIPPKQCLVPDGAACSSSTQCASGSCASNVCATTGGSVTPPPPPPLAALGGACQATADCAANLACSAGTCLVPDGGTCTASTECASGSCSSSTCVAPVVPPTPTPVNGPCTSSVECATGLVCSSSQCLVPPGGQCSVGTACTSGWCSTSGACLEPVGGACTYGTECSSGTCNAGTCAQGGAGSPCLIGPECLSGTCGATQTCAIGGAGAPCAANGDCSSGICGSDGKCSASPTSLPVGATCSQNVECTSGICGQCTSSNCSGYACQPGAQGAVCATAADCQLYLGCVNGYCAPTTTQ